MFFWTCFISRSVRVTGSLYIFYAKCWTFVKVLVFCSSLTAPHCCVRSWTVSFCL